MRRRARLSFPDLTEHIVYAATQICRRIPHHGILLTTLGSGTYICTPPPTAISANLRFPTIEAALPRRIVVPAGITKTASPSAVLRSGSAVYRLALTAF